MNKQAAFDTALHGILDQGAPSFFEGRVFYRAPDGLRCPIGHLIPFWRYRREMENARASAQLVADAIGAARGDIPLLIGIQRAHDDRAKLGGGFLYSFRLKMHELAREYGLEYRAEVPEPPRMTSLP